MKSGSFLKGVRSRTESLNFFATIAAFAFSGWTTHAAPPASTLLDAPDAQGASIKPKMPKKTLPGRARHAKVRFETLDADTLILNLFDDTTLTAVRDRVVQNLHGGSVWVGHIQNSHDSEVTLAAKNQVLMGTIEWNGRSFEIVYAGGNTHAVRENDPHKIPAQFEPEELQQEHTSADGDTTSSTTSTATAATTPTETGQVIDILVVYTSKARANSGGASGIEAKIMNALTRANQAYLNSKINMQLNLVKMAETPYVETGDMSVSQSRLRGTTDGYMDEVHTLRNQVAADQVVLISAESNYCGFANIMTSVSTSFASSAFSVLHDDSVYNCLGTYDSFAHELGHNQGNVHNVENTSISGAYSDSYGYRACGAYRDIMSYNCSGEPRIPYFSNPDVLYNGQPTGILGSSNTARSMNATAPTVASFRTSATSGNAPNAPSGLAATPSSSSTIALSWSDNASDETGYYVQRSLDGANWSLIATLGSNAGSFTSGGLNADTTYSYRVFAYNSVGNSGFSNIASARTQAPVIDTTAPAVTISNPLSGAKIGTPSQIISVGATDNVSVTLLRLLIDGKQVASISGGSLNYKWSTRKVAAGSHTIVAEGSDAAGNKSTASITVTK